MVRSLRMLPSEEMKQCFLGPSLDSCLTLWCDVRPWCHVPWCPARGEMNWLIDIGLAALLNADKINLFSVFTTQPQLLCGHISNWIQTRHKIQKFRYTSYLFYTDFYFFITIFTFSELIIFLQCPVSIFNTSLNLLLSSSMGYLCCQCNVHLYSRCTLLQTLYNMVVALPFLPWLLQLYNYSLLLHFWLLFFMFFCWRMFFMPELHLFFYIRQDLRTSFRISQWLARE
jgi:hypothetical protein